MLEKAKGAATGAPAKGSLKGPLTTTPRCQVVRVATSASQLTELLERFRWYKYDVMQLLIKVRSLHVVTSRGHFMWSLHVVTSCGHFKVFSSSYMILSLSYVTVISHDHFIQSLQWVTSPVMSFGQFILSHYCHFNQSFHLVISLGCFTRTFIQSFHVVTSL